MITGKSGYFDLKGSVSTFTLRVNWSEEYDEITNTSLVRIDSVQVKSTKYANGYFPDGLVKINGQTVITMNSYYGTHSLGVHGLGPWYAIKTAGDEVASGSTEVVHEADGSKSVVIEVTGNRLNGCRFIGGTSGEDNGWYVSGSQTVELTAIPRASTVTASDAEIGAAAKIAITKRSAAYTHSVAFSFGTLSGYLTETGEITDTETRFSWGSVSFPLPESFYYEIPNAPSGVCTLTVRTYSGDTQIGEEQTAAFTVRANQANCAPILSGTAADTNAATLALTGDESILIKNASTVLCDLSVQARYGATITERSVNGQSIEGDTVTLSPFTADSVVFRVVDSRGFETQYACPVAVIGYYLPTLTASATRTDPTSGNAVITVRGSCYPGTFGAAENTLQVIYAIGGGAEVAQVLTVGEDGTYLDQIPVTGLDYEAEHSIQIRAEDAVQTTETKTLWVGKGIPVFDWGESDFQFHVPVNMNGNGINNYVTVPDTVQITATGQTNTQLQSIYTAMAQNTTKDVILIHTVADSLPYTGTWFVTIHKNSATHGEISAIRSISGPRTVEYRKALYDGEWSDWEKVTTAKDLSSYALESLFADYVVARGTDGIWTYEKWNSGKAECYGSQNYDTVPITTKWGDWYESAALTQDFPAALFTAVPNYLSISVAKSSNGIFVSQGWGSDISTSNTGTFSLARPSSMTVSKVCLNFHAIGRWE